MKNLTVNEKVMVDIYKDNVSIELSDWGVTMWKRYAFCESESKFSGPDAKEKSYNGILSKLNDHTLETTVYEIMQVYGPYLKDSDPDISHPFTSSIKVKKKSL